MKKGKTYRLPILIAFNQWLITTVLQVDRAFFTYNYITKKLLLIKALYLMFLLVSWCFVFDVYKKIKAGDTFYKRGLEIFSVYFLIMIVFLLILWPGTWSWDDLLLLNAIQTYKDFRPWQHVITGIYQDVLLQVLPFPGGIVFLQNVIVSLCVAFSVVKLESTYNLKKLNNACLDIFIKIIPFLLPPILVYQFSGYRMGLYVYLELVTLLISICAITNEEKWTWRYIFLFCFLVVVVATWRTESFLYAPTFCILLLLTNKVKLSFNKRLVSAFLIVFGFLGVSFLQNISLKMISKSNYQIISTIRPCVELVRATNYGKDNELLNEINKVVQLDVIYNNPEENGENLYWYFGVVRKNYTEEDYKDYVIAFVKLSLKYPKIVLAERTSLFIATLTGKYEDRICQNGPNLFDENDNRAAKLTLSKGWIANTPILKHGRRMLMNIFLQRKWIIQKLIWNAIIPMVSLICGGVKLLLQKKESLLFLCATILARILIIMLTEPSNWFMYILPIYLLGYVFIIYTALACFRAQKEK